MSSYPFFQHGTIEALAATFLLVMCRVAGVIVGAPALGETSSPMMVRAALTFWLSILLLPVVEGYFTTISVDMMRMPSITVAVILAELLYGIFIGWLARVVGFSFVIALQFIAVFTGFSSILQPDRQLGSQSTAFSHMADVFVPIVLFSSGLYIIPLTAMVHSYTIFPPGHMPMVGDMARTVAYLTSQSFGLALQIAAPFVLIGTLWPAMLGVLNRLMPSIQVYSMAMPGQILGGLFLLAILFQTLSRSWQAHYESILMSLSASMGM